jgi:hypothetical protein
MRPEERQRPRLQYAKRALVVLAAIMALSSHLIADCPMLGPPCGELARTTVVFYGQVRKATPLHRTIGPGNVSREQEVEFDVLQTVKGVKRGTFTAIFQLNSESTTFTLGNRFLVYARPHDGRLSTGCTRTKPALTASESATLRDELTTLRGCGQAVR